MLLCTFGASGQSTPRTAYFSDGVLTRHSLNAAFEGERGYISIPMLGSLDMTINSNLSVDKIFYPLEDGGLGIFLNPEVDSDSFLASIDENNLISQSFNLTIFSTGFHAWGGYNTIGFGVREDFDMNIKSSLFEFLVGASSSDDSSIYNMSGSSLSANSWSELSFGHSRQFGDNLRVGVKVKYLAGIATGNFNLDEMLFSSNSNMMSLDLGVTGAAAVMGMPLSGALSELSFSGFDMGSALNSGVGIDFGATYQWDRFNFSVAMNDMGAIYWKRASDIFLEADIEFNGLTSIDPSDVGSSSSDDVNDFLAEFEALADPTFLLSESYCTKLKSTLNFGVEYTIIEDKLTAGLLSTTTFGDQRVQETMIAASYSPTSWLNLALSGTTSTYGTYMGCFLNFRPSWINFYIGSDSLFFHITPQGIPYRSGNVNINFGANIPFGASR